jgi:hypothetical protein
MSIQTAQPIVDTRFLGRVLLGNAIFTALSGLACLAWPRPLAVWLGIEQPLILSVLGIILLLSAGGLAWIAMRTPSDRRMVQAIFILDVVWVIVSALALLAGWPPLTATGKWIIAGVADVVAVFALLEFVGLRRMQNETASYRKCADRPCLRSFCAAPNDGEPLK